MTASNKEEYVEYVLGTRKRKGGRRRDGEGEEERGGVRGRKRRKLRVRNHNVWSKRESNSKSMYHMLYVGTAKRAGVWWGGKEGGGGELRDEA